MSVINPINALVMTRRLRRRRKVTAVIAVIFSLALHGFLAEGIRQGWFEPIRAARLAEPSQPPRSLDIELRPDEWIRTVERMDSLRFIARERAAERVADAAPEIGPVDLAVIEPERSPEQLMDDAMRSDPATIEPSPLVDIGPGQEILQITERVAADPSGDLRRLMTPPVDRIRQAPDIVVPAAETEFRARVAADPLPILPGVGGVDFGAAAWTPALDGDGMFDSGDGLSAVDESVRQSVSDRMDEAPSAIARQDPIDRYLKARVRKYIGGRDRQYGYLQIEIERYDEDFLEVLPKDVFFIMDLSGSMGQRRVAAGGEGIRQALSNLGPRDRFNIVTFAHAPGSYADNWVAATPAQIARVPAFLDGMVSGGMTDIDAALNHILALERDPRRPTLALMLTDGIPTAGITNSTRIIEDFTVRNRGDISMFAVAAAPDTIANMYLLDMLAYRNRGDSRVMQTGRWEIPALTDQLSREFARPVLTDLRYRFTHDSACEAYPVVLSHLFLDRPLVLYGRFPRDKQEVVFQVVGQSGGRAFDFFFRLPLDQVETGDTDIRLQWARHRMYHLVGEHMRTGDASVLRELFETARQFGLEIPYLENFSPPSRLLPWR